MKFSELDVRKLRDTAQAFVRSPRVRKFAWWGLGVVVVVGVLGVFVAPPLVRVELEKQLSQGLHRAVTIESLSINPFALSATAGGLRVTERGTDAAALTVAELYVRASWSSLLRWAPVLSAIRITQPRLQIARTEAHRYNWSDLIDEILDKPKNPDEPPAQFSLANVEIDDGEIVFDDRPEKVKHTLSAIQLAVPFLSSLPVYQDVEVEPRFSAKLNGAPIELTASAKLFKDTRDSTLKLDVKGLDLTRYLEYLPGKLPVAVHSAKLDADIELKFAQPKDRAPTVVVSGKAALVNVDLRDPSGVTEVTEGNPRGTPVLKFARFAVEMHSVEPLLRRFEVRKVEIDSPHLNITRRKNGEIFPLSLLQPAPRGFPSVTPVAKPPDKPAAEKTAPQYTVGEILLTRGQVEAVDERGAAPIRSNLDDLHVTIKGLSSKPGASARIELAEHSRDDEALALDGSFGLQPVQAAGTLKLERVRFVKLWPYLAPLVAFDAADGQIDLRAAFILAAQEGGPLNVQVKGFEADLRSLVLKQRWDQQEVLRVAALAVRGADFDLLARTVKLGELTSSGGRLAVRRDRDGNVNLKKLLAASAVTRSGTLTSTAASPQPWTGAVQKIALDGYAATVEDEAAGPAATARIENLSFSANNLSTAKGQSADVSLKLTINQTGSLALSGPVSIAPVSARLKVLARKIGIVPAEPYFERYVNAIVSSGDVSAKGDATVDLADDGTVRGAFNGNLMLANFAAVTKDGNEELLRWKSLRFVGVDVASAPLKAAIAEIALSDFYARVNISPEGRVNLQDLVVRKEAPATADGVVTAVTNVTNGNPSGGNPSGGNPSGGNPSGTARVDASPAPVPAIPAPAGAATAVPVSAPVPDIKIGKITLAGGNVNFSDHFIKPNYSANLTGLGGSVSALSRDAAGDVELRATIDDTAPVEIAGKINPLAANLFLDIKASAHDIEMSPLSPYAEKYVGYGIQKGKLSMNVAYKLEDRKLIAQNKVILNQLTFGDKVESPNALKVPVLFAVSLLKDRNGVIEVDLPISGSIDDPQFSLGGIILELIGKMLLKAVTAPFALIGSLFGGSGHGNGELAYIEFAPGLAILDSAGEEKLKSLSKALVERPALYLDIAGRVDPDIDRDALKQDSLMRKVKAQKLKESVKSGTAAGALDKVAIDPAEYPKYLAKAYGDEKFTKPRNVVGLAKTLPVPEMEQLMRANAQVTDEDLRQLAEEREQAVKDYLIEICKIPDERLFLLAPRMNAEGVKDNGKRTRVDLVLK